MSGLSKDARAVVAGLVQPNGVVCSEGIFADRRVWEELLAEFPLAEFQAWVAQDPARYDDEAGL